MYRHRLPVDLGRLYGLHTGRDTESSGGSPHSGVASRPTVRIDVGSRTFPVPPSSSRPRPLTVSTVSTMHQEHNPTTARVAHAGDEPIPPGNPVGGKEPGPELHRPSGVVRESSPIPRALAVCPGPLHDAERARSEAHRAFLRVTRGVTDLIGRHLALQLELIEDWQNGSTSPVPAQDARPRTRRPIRRSPQTRRAVLFEPAAVPGVRRRIDRHGLGA